MKRTRFQYIPNTVNSRTLLTLPKSRLSPRGIASYLPFIALPFFLFFRTLPFISGITIGNDYPIYHIQHQLELFFALRTGVFPLFVPGFLCGQTANALTLGQLFHPLPHIASLLPGYWDGMALELNTFLRILTLGIAHAAMFSLLKRIGWLSKAMCFLLSLVTVYNLRMLDMFRFGASLEGWTGHLFLCASLGHLYFDRRKTWPALMVIFSTYWLVTSGHPQAAYFGFLGTSTFVFCFPLIIRPSTIRTPIRRKSILSYWLFSAVLLSAGVVCGSAYWLPFYVDFLKENAGRYSQTYQWSITNQCGIIDIVNCFFLPLRSNVEGAFGAVTTLSLSAFVTPFVLYIRKRANPAIWISWFIVVAALLFALGNATPFHYVLWRIFPFFSSLRVPGRITAIIPIHLLLLSIGLFAHRKKYSYTVKTQCSERLISYVCVGVAVATLFYAFLPHTDSAGTFLTPHHIGQIPSYVDTIVTALCIIVALAVAGGSFRNKKSSLFETFAVIVACCALWLVISYGTWLEPKTPTTSYDDFLKQKHHSLQYRHEPGNGLYSHIVWNHLESFTVEPRPAVIEHEHVTCRSVHRMYALLSQGARRAGQSIVVDTTIAERYSDAGVIDTSSALLISNNSNHMRLECHTVRPSLLVVNTPWSKNWHAYANGNRSPILRANGAVMAVRLPPGRAIVQIMYRSRAATYGILVSCLGAWLTFVLLLIRGRHFSLKHALPGFMLFACIVVGIFLWFNSRIASTRSFGTRYYWTSHSLPPRNNIAFGKPAHMSSILNRSYPHLFCAGRAVDGDTAKSTGCVSAQEQNPLWQIWFGDLYELQEIVLFERRLEGQVLNERPLFIQSTTDGIHWRTIATITTAVHAHRTRVVLNTTELSRGLTIRATGLCKLALDEVQIFGIQQESNYMNIAHE